MPGVVDICGHSGGLEASIADRIASNGSIIHQSESIPSHPLGIKPLGNQYLSNGPNSRASLGLWGALPDETIMLILEHFDELSLLGLGSTCKFLYAFCYADELWKALFLS